MDEFAQLLGESPAMKAIRDTVGRLLDRQRAGSRLPPVLLQGETGTGKGLVAGLLHRHGTRRAGPFVDLNCAAIPGDLLEAELFGFERGAFTDASHAKPGLFQAAQGGVLFLDEIALLPEALQAKLLSAIEQRAVRRLGSTRLEPVDVWIVSATNSNLDAAVRAGRFRDDLYHRLAVVTLTLPPLRERGRDVLFIARRFLARACTEYSLPPKQLDGGAESRLLAHSWPGNIRELGNVIERAVLFADTPVLTAGDLGPLEAESTVPDPPSSPVASRDELLRQRLLATLEETGWNISLAASQLGVARNTVYARLEKFGLRAESKGNPGVAKPPRSAGGGGSPAPPPALQWERRNISLLRVDLREADGLEAASRSSRTLDAILAKVASFGGRVEDLTPRGLVAAFGVDPLEDAPRRAALAAIAVQRQAERAREGAAKGPGIVIVLHVAPLLVGRGGPRAEIDAGAKRASWPVLEQLAQDAATGEVVASPTAATFLERRFELEGLEIGTGRVTAHRLTGRERRGFGLWGTTTPFVGRQDELSLLHRRSALASGGHGQVVAVVGEAGVGKSRLIDEFARQCRLAGWRVLDIAGVSYGQTMSYLPVIELLKSYFAIHDRDDLHAIREKVTGALLALDRGLAPALPALLDLLGAPPDDAGWRALEPPQRRRRTLDAVKRLLLQEARERPLLLIFEDLHWIDRETQALLEGLVESLGSARLLLLVSYRPEYRRAWTDKTSSSELRVDALPVERTGDFLDVLLGPGQDLALLKQVLIERGNPFFLEETVRTLVEERALEGKPGGYRIAQPVPTLRIPPTVQAVLAARIDRLAPEDRRLLLTAAVIGKDVPLALLYAVAEGDAPSLRASLARLRTAEFLCEAEAAREAEYAFKHALTHEVAYEELLPEHRCQIHARIVEAIETLHRDRLEEHSERLAHHAEAGQLRDKAVQYLRQAGTRAAARSALPDARGWLERAIAVLESLPASASTLEQSFDIRLELRLVLSHLGEVRSMLGRLREALALAERLNDDRRRSRASTYMVLAHTLLAEPDEALVAGAEAMKIAQRLEDPGPRLFTTTYLAQAHYYRGDYARSVDLARRVVEALPADWAYERSNRSMPVGCYERYWLVLSFVELGCLREAGLCAAELLRLVEPTRHAFSIGLAHWAASKLHLVTGDWAKAHSTLERGVAAQRGGYVELSLPRAVAASAWVLAEMGDASAALARLREGEQLLERDAARGLVDRPGEAYHSLSRAALGLGRIGEARALAERALESSSSHPGFAAYARHLLGEIATHPYRFEAGLAETHYRAALALAEPRGMRPLVAHCHLGLGRLRRRTGEHQCADEEFATAAAMYGEMELRSGLDRAEAERTRPT